MKNQDASKVEKVEQAILVMASKSSGLTMAKNHCSMVNKGKLILDKIE